MITCLTITPRDPMIARDARPFGAGHHMKSYDWPYPSVVAGSLRTLLGKQRGGRFSPEDVKNLLGTGVAGPLPMLDGELYFAAPRDMLVGDDGEGRGSRTLMPLRPLPLRQGEGCGLEAGMHPVRVADDVKPARVPAFWSRDRMCEWLADASGTEFPAPPRPIGAEAGFLGSPEKDERIHVQIERDSGAAEEGLLFKTVGLDLLAKGGDRPPVQLSLAARVEAGDGFAEALSTLDALHPCGGERRLARWRSEPSTAWDFPGGMMETLRKASRLRLVLATPALFDQGWRPDWLVRRAGELGVGLRLVSACVERWKPIAGFGLESGKAGPKPARRLVPAGSVYFFEADKGDIDALAEQLWLQPVSDREQDRRDGFGLALWGAWDYAQDQTAGGTSA